MALVTMATVILTKDCKVSWLFLLALENVKRKEKFTQNTLRQLESLEAL